jgi:hypothetical protein
MGAKANTIDRVTNESVIRIRELVKKREANDSFETSEGHFEF